MAYNLNAKEHILKNENERVTSDYGNRTITVNEKTVSGFHSGIDMISAIYGTDYIVAFAAGTVVATRNTISGYDESNASGNYVYVDHGNGYQTRYRHLKKDTLQVKVGDKVSKGQTLAYMNSTGFSSGNHIHFEVRKNGAAENPKEYLLGTKQIEIIVPKPETPSGQTYVVVSGDTLWAIAQRYLGNGNRYPEIAKLNNIANPNLIHVGQVLRIPGSATTEETVTYTVVRGDTLSGIASRYNMSWKTLYEQNKHIIGNNPNLIYPGQKLRIR